MPTRTYQQGLDKKTSVRHSERSRSRWKRAARIEDPELELSEWMRRTLDWVADHIISAGKQ